MQEKGPTWNRVDKTPAEKETGQEVPTGEWPNFIPEGMRALVLELLGLLGEDVSLLAQLDEENQAAFLELCNTYAGAKNIPSAKFAERAGAIRSVVAAVRKLFP